MFNDEKMRQEWKNFTDNFWDVILLNILFFFSCLPIFSAGAAVCALHFSVSRLNEKRSYGGAAQMYWLSFKTALRRVTPLWLIILSAFFVIYLDIAIMNTVAGLGKYAYYGLLGFVVLLLLCFVCIGIPIMGRRGIGIKQTVIESLSVLARCPLRTVLACILAVFPFVLLFVSPKTFIVLFLFWICLYFSLAELLINLMLKRE